ncbi:MAG: hypothetical protein CM15mP54_22560 [Paracoccaceae bacterium]|nr:MAG: hypothetical protein CM15mP54_22560 [Paracoccaceae bacterium]
MANPLYDNLIGKHATNDACFLRQPGKPAVSFRQFSERTSQVANLLLKHGLKPGDRVAVQASKTIEMVILYGATIQAGGVFLSLNTDYKKMKSRTSSKMLLQKSLYVTRRNGKI